VRLHFFVIPYFPALRVSPLLFPGLELNILLLSLSNLLELHSLKKRSNGNTSSPNECLQENGILSRTDGRSEKQGGERRYCF
jgi:hypothetical protein